MKRQEILEKIRQALEKNLLELNQALASYEAASDLDEGDTVDPDDFSKAAEYKEMQMRTQVQLDTAKAHLVRLNDLSGNDHKVAETGALVQTDKNWFFLGLSFANLTTAGQDIIGISPESPAFMAIKGKTPGETFVLGKEAYRILAIH